MIVILVLAVTRYIQKNFNATLPAPTIHIKQLYHLFHLALSAIACV